MTLTVPSFDRPLPVRLTQIRPEVRYRAAQQIAERSPGDGPECLFAALHPSDTTYWIALDAWPILRSVAA
jgi:hypothetical protein